MSGRVTDHGDHLRVDLAGCTKARREAVLKALTPQPCPAWCAITAEEHDREEELELDSVPGARVHHSRRIDSPIGELYLAWVSGGSMVEDEPLIHSGGLDPLTAAAARQLAAALVELADEAS